MIEKLYRYRIIIVFHGIILLFIVYFIEITDFDFFLPPNKKNNIVLEYSVLNNSKSYRLQISKD